jgi:prolyl-tRNA synthetase
VAADTGAIGGDRSHEFQVIADTGEDAIIYCPDSDYAANIELAEAVAPVGERPAASAALTKVHTPKVKTIADLVDFLSIDIKSTVKALVVEGSEGEAVLMLVRGDHELNEVKAEKVAGIKKPLTMASPAIIREALVPIRVRWVRSASRVASLPTVPWPRWPTLSSVPTKTTSITPVPTSAVTVPSRKWPTSAMWWPATPARTARACWPSSAASKWAMCSTWAPSTPPP